MRYKGNLSAADELYAASIRVLPLLGDPWNQRGLLLAKRDVLKCLYFHYRALHCRFSFIGATSNIQKIFQEHSETTVLVDSPFVDRFLHVLSKFYFMTRVHQRLVDSLLEECITMEAIVPLLGVLSELGRLLDNEVPIRDSELTRFWLCFEDPCDRPLTAGGLARTLCAIRDGEVINRKEINSGAKEELSRLLDDLVSDSLSCPGTVVARDETRNEVIGVCLASRHHLFDQQLDRLCRYSFTDKGLSIAVEFLKYVFNRVDVAYHLEEAGVSKPVFVVLVGVKPEYQKGGLGKRLLNESLDSARNSSDRCDSAFTVCTSEGVQPLYHQHFRQVISRVKYSDYRGEFRDPPIRPKAANSLLVLLAKL
ncbi:unnamed protein product, partial [Mesorhabditis spiculigera]